MGDLQEMERPGQKAPPFIGIARAASYLLRVTPFHEAIHAARAALKQVQGEDVRQKGPRDAAIKALQRATGIAMREKSNLAKMLTAAERDIETAARETTRNPLEYTGRALSAVGAAHGEIQVTDPCD